MDTPVKERRDETRFRKIGETSSPAIRRGEEPKDIDQVLLLDCQEPRRKAAARANLNRLGRPAGS